MYAFGPTDQSPWDIYNQNGSVMRHFAAREYAKVKKVPSIAAGQFVLVLESGLVLSVQPGGQIQVRPAGSDGAWEQCASSGTLVAFAPDDVKYVFGLV